MPNSYDTLVAATNGLLYWWKLGESSGTSAADSKGTNTGTYNGTVTLGQTGIPGTGNDTAALFSDAYVSTTTSVTNPVPFSTEVWFKATSTAGMGLVLLGAPQTGNSSAFTADDRRTWLGTDGKVYFGIYSSGVIYLVSPLTYNDGNWHHVVGTCASNNNMALFVDGVMVASNSNSSAPQNYSGWWRIGSTQSAAPWPNAGSGDGFYTGTIAQAAVYSLSLSPAVVASHYTGNPVQGQASEPTVRGSIISASPPSSRPASGQLWPRGKK